MRRVAVRYYPDTHGFILSLVSDWFVGVVFVSGLLCLLWGCFVFGLVVGGVLGWLLVVFWVGCVYGEETKPFLGVWSPVLVGLWWFLTLPRSLVRSTISVA